MSFFRRIRFAGPLTGLISLTALSTVFAQAPPAPPVFTPEGRPTAGVQVGTPTPDIATGVTFEKQRIKRTVPLEPKTAFSEGRWDALYAVTEPNGPKVAYFNWDANNIYIAWESPEPEAVRFDLDGNDDGFLRGADNLRIQIEKPQSQGEDTPVVTPAVTTELWDATQNGDHPTRVNAPLPPNAIQAVAGRTAKGTYVLMVAIGKTELTGLPRNAGRNIGLRIESGLPLTAPDGTTLLSNRPLVHLTLADRVEAKDNELRVSLKIISGKELVPGDGLRAILEAKNEGVVPINVTRLFVRGSQASQPFVDSASFTGMVLKPGESTKRELKSTVAPTTPVGTHVLSGGAELENTNGSVSPVPVTIASLASFDRVDAYYVRFIADRKPVLTSSERSVGGSKVITLAVGSRVDDTVRAQVELKLPLDWSVDGGDGTNRTIVLRGRGDVNPIRVKVLVPSSTKPGQYLIEGSVTMEGNVYTTVTNVAVETAPATPPAKKK